MGIAMQVVKRRGAAGPNRMAARRMGQAIRIMPAGDGKRRTSVARPRFARGSHRPVSDLHRQRDETDDSEPGYQLTGTIRDATLLAF